MATVRISQLTAITTPTDDDVLIINDADTNTRKITFANLTQGLLNTTATAQTKTGALTISGTLTASSNFVVDTNTFFVNASTNRVGIRTTSPATEFDIDGVIHIRNSQGIEFGDANDSNYVSLAAPSVVVSNFSLTLPAALPASDALVTSTSGGTLGFTTGISATAGTLSLSQVHLADQGSVRFYEAVGGGSEYISFGAPASLATTTAYTLPAALPVATGYVLSSTTGGVLSWVSNAAGAAGAASEVQFNTGGVLDASANFTFQSGSNLLTVSNVTITADLSVQGNSTLGDGPTDNITFSGRANSDLSPIVDGTHDLGASGLRWAEIHGNDLYVYGNTELGNASGDLISVNGSIDTDLIASGSRNLGSTSAQWSNIFVSGAYVENNVSSSYSRSQAGVATTASYDVVIGSATVANSAKILIQARDVVTGDVEFYEHFVVQDGAGGISEVTGSNVQAPTPGTFLTTPSTAVSGSDIELYITNTAVSGNNVDIKVQIIATA